MSIEVKSGHETSACRKAGQDLLKEAKQHRANRKEECNEKVADMMHEVGGYFKKKSRTDEFLTFSGIGERKPFKCDHCGIETFSGKIKYTRNGSLHECSACEKKIREGKALTKPMIGIKVK